MQTPQIAQNCQKRQRCPKRQRCLKKTKKKKRKEQTEKEVEKPLLNYLASFLDEKASFFPSSLEKTLKLGWYLEHVACTYISLLESGFNFEGVSLPAAEENAGRIIQNVSQNSLQDIFIVVFLMTCAAVRPQVVVNCFHPDSVPYMVGNADRYDMLNCVSAVIEESRTVFISSSSPNKGGQTPTRKTCRIFSMLVNADKTGLVKSGPVKIPFSNLANILLTIYLDWQEKHSPPETRKSRRLFPAFESFNARQNCLSSFLERSGLGGKLTTNNFRKIMTGRICFEKGFLKHNVENMLIMDRHLYKTFMNVYLEEIAFLKNQNFGRDSYLKQFSDVDIVRLSELLPDADSSDVEGALGRQVLAGHSQKQKSSLGMTLRPRSKIRKIQKNAQPSPPTQPPSKKNQIQQKPAPPAAHLLPLPTSPSKKIFLVAVLHAPPVRIVVGLDVSKKCTAATVLVGTPYAEYFASKNCSLHFKKMLQICFLKGEGKENGAGYKLMTYTETAVPLQNNPAGGSSPGTLSWEDLVEAPRQFDSPPPGKKKAYAELEIKEKMEAPGSHKNLGNVSSIEAAVSLLEKVRQKLDELETWLLKEEVQFVTVLSVEKDLGDTGSDVSMEQVNFTRAVEARAKEILHCKEFLNPLPVQALNAAKKFYVRSGLSMRQQIWNSKKIPPRDDLNDSLRCSLYGMFIGCIQASRVTEMSQKTAASLVFLPQDCPAADDGSPLVFSKLPIQSQLKRFSCFYLIHKKPASKVADFQQNLELLAQHVSQKEEEWANELQFRVSIPLDLEKKQSVISAEKDQNLQADLFVHTCPFLTGKTKKLGERQA